MANPESHNPKEDGTKHTEQFLDESNVRSINPEAFKPGDTLISAQEVLTDEDLAKYRGASASVLRILEGLYPDEAALPYAGISLNPEANTIREHYRAGFGRDTLVALSFLLDKAPALQVQPFVAKALEQLAKLQGATYDAVSEEAPGKIIHETRSPADPRRQELEAKGWKFPYYGSVDATPLFIINACRYIETCDTQFANTAVTVEAAPNTKPMSQTVAEAVTFLKTELGSSQTGFLEFFNPNNVGNKAQNWTDSEQAFHFSNGEIANFDQPIAALEVQALAYDALLAAAKLFPDQSVELLGIGRELRDRTLRQFWLEEKGYFAMGLDHDPEDNVMRPIDAKRSSMGWLLDSSILVPQPDDNPELVDRLDQLSQSVIRQLFTDDMLAPFGIRTLSADSPMYRATQYHNGCIWAFDSAIIARGLERHGYFGLAREINDRVLTAINALGFLPEFYNSGNDELPQFNRWDIEVTQRDGRVVHAAAPPKEVQLWTAAAIARIKRLNGRDAFEREPMPDAATDHDKLVLERTILSNLHK